MGAPVHIFRGSAFQDLDRDYGRSRNKITQCVPVMTSNPVTCEKGGGRLDKVEETKLRLTLDIPLLEGMEREVQFARNLSQAAS